MKSKLLIGLLFTASINFAVAQEQFPCSQHIENEKLIASDPSILKRMEGGEKYFQEYITRNKLNRKNGNETRKIIPIVFHIIHAGGSENLSLSNIYNVINQLNIDYQKLNSDTSEVDPTFTGIIGNANIEFRLATIDPKGNPTNGITRHYDENTNAANDNVKQNTAWNTGKYLNVWIINSFATPGAGAYAYKPYTFQKGSANMGVICLARQFGTLSPSGNNLLAKRTIPHEVGHCFNLDHTWGGTNDPGVNCNGDDNVDDTPKTIGTVGQSCNKSAKACDGVSKANTENTMDYSSCPKMFTKGQVNRMQAALEDPNSSITDLWRTANLIATGTDDNAIIREGKPKVEFYLTSPAKACTGVAINFFSSAYNNDTITYKWIFEGANQVEYLTADANVTWSTPGKYDVTIIAYTSAGSDTFIKNDFITIYPANATGVIPIAEGFENANIPVGWEVENPSGAVKWAITNTTAFTGDRSIFIKNFNGNPDASSDAFTTPFINMGNLQSAYLTFRVAYARRNTSRNDRLIISLSNDCGLNYGSVYNKAGNALKTTTVEYTTAYMPEKGGADWRKDSISLNNFTGSGYESLIVKFENISDVGNNIYIDDINISSNSVGVNSLISNNLNLELYPNPTENTTTFSFNLIDTQKINLNVTDMLGRIIEQVASNTTLDFGTHKYMLGQNINKGIYFVNLSVDGQVFTKKLIIQ